MNRKLSHAVPVLALTTGLVGLVPLVRSATTPAPQAEPIQFTSSAEEETVTALVGRLDLQRYKDTVRGLTEFGDRREGTQRNRDAVDWIQAQLESYGCSTEIMHYDAPPPREPRGGGGGRAGRGGGRGGGERPEPPPPPAGTPDDPVRRGAGGKGYGGPTGVNNNPERQPDVELRELNMGPVLPDPRPQVYCTKVGATRPDEMYIVSAHMDGIGYGQAANDDGSGTAIVMELARIFSSPDVVTDRSIRFALWNGEEGGLRGSRAYVAQRQELQGIENPAGSGRYPEPRWLGVAQHDMMMFDHGMPHPDGRVSLWQRPEADTNIEFQQNSDLAAQSMMLALFFKNANEDFGTLYPATLGPHMQSTDSVPFEDIIPSISLRENERRDHVGYGWNPHWHQTTDVFETFSDDDFRLGLSAAQTTLAAIAQLVGAKVQ